MKKIDKILNISKNMLIISIVYSISLVFGKLARRTENILILLI